MIRKVYQTNEMRAGLIKVLALAYEKSETEKGRAEVFGLAELYGVREELKKRCKQAE